MRVISWEYEIYMQMSESCDIFQSIKIHWSCLGILQICFSSRWAEQQMSAIYFVMKNIKDQPSKSYKGRTCYICMCLLQREEIKLRYYLCTYTQSDEKICHKLPNSCLKLSILFIFSAFTYFFFVRCWCR